MAKKSKGKSKGWAPKQVEQARASALEMTERWIAAQGGDRRRSDPGLSREAIREVGDVAFQGQPPSYAQMAEIYAEHGRQLSHEDYRFELGTLAVGIHRMIRWVNLGMPVFLLDKDTATMLALTDVDTLDIADVKFPFPTFLVVLEAGTPLYLDHDGHVREVRYIWVHHHERPDGGMAMQVVPATDLYGGISLPSPLPVLPGEPVALWTDPGRRGPQMFGETMTPTDVATLSATVRLVVSLAMHLSQQRATSQKPWRPGVDASHVQSLGLPLPKDWIVAPISMPAEIRQAVREGGQRVAAELTARHVVRGHWRMQPVGPGRAFRKATWISPHWRGRGPQAISKVHRNPGDTDDLLSWS